MRRNTVVWTCTLMFVVLASAACQAPDAPALVSPTAAPHTTTATATARIVPTSTPAPTATPARPSPTATDLPTLTPSDTPTPPVPVALIHPRLLRTIGVGQGTAIALAPNRRYLAVATTTGWGLYALPDLHEVRFEVLAGGVGSLRWSANSARLMVVPDQNSRAITYRIPDGVGVQSTQSGYNPLLSADGSTIALIHGADTLGIKGASPRPVFSSVVFASTATGTPFGSSDGLLANGMPAFSPDNKLFAAELDGYTAIWQTDRGLGRPTSSPVAEVDGIHPVFSQNGQFMATTVVLPTATEVRLWGMPVGQLLGRLVIGPESAGQVQIAIHDDGEIVDVIPDPLPNGIPAPTNYIPPELQIWDSRHEKLLQRSTILVASMLFGPGGRVLAAYNGNNVGIHGIRFIGVADGHVLYQDDQAIISSFQERDWVSWSADGTTAVYLTDDGQVHLIDLVHGTARKLAFQASSSPTFSPDGRTLAAVQSHSAVNIWRVDDPAIMRQFLPPMPVPPNLSRSLSRVSFTPDGRALVAQASDSIAPVLDYAAIRWELAGGQRGRTVATLKTWSDEGVSVYVGPLYSPVTNTFVWGDYTGIRIQWDSGVLSTIPLTNRVSQMALSSDGQRLAVYDINDSYNLSDHRLDLFALAPTAVKLLRSVSLKDLLVPTRMSFSPDGALLGMLMPSSGGGQIWRPGIGSPVSFGADLHPGTTRFDVLSITADDRMVIMATNTEVRFYRLSAGIAAGADPITVEHVGSIAIAADEIAVSPAGDRLAVISAGQLTLWDIGS
jgi:WD40 repeat protein